MAERIDEGLVRRVADLSRLTLTDQEIASMSRELSAIVGYIDQLSALDTTSVPPTTHAAAVRDVFREDVERDSFGSEASLRNAPRRAGAFFEVPKVLDPDGGA